jgi:hypothetical protein
MFDITQKSEIALTIPPCKPARLRSRAIIKMLYSQRKIEESDVDECNGDEEEEKTMVKPVKLPMEVEETRPKRAVNRNYSTRGMFYEDYKIFMVTV